MSHEALSFADLSDNQLLVEVKHLAANERHATAALIRSLMELDARRLYLGEGCSSLFTFCTQVLHLAEGAAYNRIEAARAARRFPSILEMLDEGALNLTTVRLLAPHLTIENHGEVLAAARFKSKRDVECLLAGLKPKPDVPTAIRKMPAAPRAEAEQASSAPAVACQSELTAAPSDVARSVAAAENVLTSRPVVALLTPERYKVQFTISRQTHDKLQRARDLLRHAIPNGDFAQIFDRALTLLVDDLERRRFAATAAPRGSTSASRSRHIPASVRREVWRRDEGRCAFVGRSGRCGERGFLEFHHVDPHAAGGVATVENIQLRCRAHNQYEASLDFPIEGPELIHEGAV